MTAEAGVDEELFAVVRFRELEQEDAGREVVDVGQAERGEGGGEFVSDDADVEGGEALFHRRGYERRRWWWRGDVREGKSSRGASSPVFSRYITTYTHDQLVARLPTYRSS